MTPLLTVAIPTCNGTAHLAEALHSILNQECPPFDLLVSDDHSDDDTVALVREIAGERARIVVNEERLGLAGNWNQCMALSRTPWVSIFHQDDVMLPGHLAWVHEGIEQIERDLLPVGLIAGPIRVIDEHSQTVPRSIVDPGGIRLLINVPCTFVDFTPDEIKHIWWDNPLRCSAVITSRQAHAEAGGFDPSLRYVVDWDFWERVCRTKHLAWKSNPKPTVLVRWHADSETHRFKSGIDDLEEVERLLHRISEQDNAEHRHARKRLTFANSALSRAYLNRAHEALRAGQIELSRSCLARAWSISPGKVMRTVAVDPRLCIQMATLAASPRLARRWFGRDHERA